MKENQVDAHPAGSLPLGEGDNPPQETQTEVTPEPKIEIPEKFAGKSVEDIIKSYSELEAEKGRLSNEVGSTRKQAELAQKQADMLLNQISSIQQAQAKSGPQEPDFNAELTDIQSKVESGDIDLGTALRKTAELTANRAGTIAEQKLGEVLQKKDAEALRSNFLKSNPDFTELQATGALKAIRDENPLHDDFSAYHELKRRDAVSQVEAAKQAALEEGKKEGAKLAAGAEAAGRVVGKAGGSPRTATNTLPKNEGEKIQSMLDALHRVRGGG